MVSYCCSTNIQTHWSVEVHYIKLTGVTIINVCLSSNAQALLIIKSANENNEAISIT